MRRKFWDRATSCPLNRGITLSVSLNFTYLEQHLVYFCSHAMLKTTKLYKKYGVGSGKICYPVMQFDLTKPLQNGKNCPIGFLFFAVIGRNILF